MSGRGHRWQRIVAARGRILLARQQLIQESGCDRRSVML
jgi:hypothetical protein